MALIDKASLLMVPSVYEDGTLYNVLPSGNKAPDETGNHNGYDQTRADFTFSRGSNLAATRVNANGLIEKGRENLYTQSNNFSHSDWTPKAGTFTQGIADPDGGNNAWAWEASNTDPYLYQNKNLSGVYCLSIWAKGSGNTIGHNIEVRVGASIAFFELTSEWQRFEAFAILSGSVNIGFEYGNPSATAGDVIHIYQAQLEVGTIATSYMDSGATTATAGVLENTPRIDYSSGAGSLKLEPQRTNVLPHSEYFGAYNLGAGVTINQNYSLSPEGVQNATRLNLTTSANIGVEKPVSGFFESQTHTISVWARCTSGTETFRLKCTHASVLDYFSNDLTATTEWQRFDFSKTFTSTSGTGIVAGVVNGTDAQARSIEIYGLQLETNSSYPSSYVPTYGSAATRGADSCSVTGVSDVIGQTEGTLFVEFEYSNNSVGVVSIHSGNIGNRVYIGTDANGLISQVRVGYAQQAFFSTSLTIGTTYKCAIAYKANDFALYVNGLQIGTDTSGSVPSSMIKLGFESGAGGDVLNQPTKQTMLFNERLTNTELAALTA